MWRRRTDAAGERAVRVSSYGGYVTAAEQFIASLAHSLGWPVAVVVLALTFRRQLSRLVDSPLSRFRAGPVEFEFQRQLAELETQVESVAPAPGDDADGVSPELRELARRVPDAAIFEAFGQVEERLRELIRESGHEPAAVGAVALARVARGRDLITAETVKAIEGLAVMRNLAAHNRSTGLAADQALEYLDIVHAVLYTLHRTRPGH